MLKGKTILTCFLFVLLSSVYIYADTISLRADYWPPYNAEMNGDKQGYMIDTVKYIFEKNGHTIDYKIIPWARAVKDCRDGEINGIIGASKDDAPDFVFPDKSEGMMENNFYVKNSKTWKYNGISSLTNEQLGIIRAYSYGKEIDEYINDKNNESRIQVISGDDALPININKLLDDKISVTIENNVVMQYTLKSMGLKDKIKSAGSLEKSELFIAFSPKNPKSKKYAEILSKGIEEMRKNGKLKEILSKYGLEDWEKKNKK